MPIKGYKKDTPRIVAKDVYQYICNNSSLTREQVKECFDVYQSMIISILNSENLDSEMTVSIPKVGFFRMVKKEGRKNTKIVVPIPSEKGKAEIKYGDTPSYLQLKVEVSNKLKVMLKENTKSYE